MITCDTLYGKQILIPPEQLVFRPAVYAVITHQKRIVLMNTKSTGKYFFPGGGVELGERLEEALHREVKEETGLKVRIERLFHFKEKFFYYDPLQEAYHSFCFFFWCSPQTFVCVDDAAVEDEESEQPRWIDLDILTGDALQSFGDLLPLIQQCYG